MSEPVRQRAALAVLVAAPLVSVPGGFSGHVPGQLLLVALGCLVAATVRPVGALPRSLVVAGVVVVAVLVVTSFAGPTPVASLVGRWPRYEGVPVVLLAGAAAWAGARVVRRDEPWLARILAAAAVVLAVATAADVARGQAREGAMLGNAADQGAVAAVAALVLARPAVRDRGPVELVGLVAALATVAASGSRAALLATAVGLVVLLARTALLPLAGVVAVALAVPSTRDRLLGSTTVESRVDQWRLTLDLVRDHLVLGVGPSRYVEVFPAYEDADFVRFTGPTVLADSPHSWVLQVLVAGGLPLLVAALAGLALVVRRCVAVVREEPAALSPVVAAAAYPVFALANPTSPGPACLAALVLGAAVSVPARADHEEPVPRVVPQVALGAAVVVLAAACVGDVRLAQGVDAAVAGDVAGAQERFDAARFWRPWDAEVAALAAPALAQRAALGLADAPAAAGLAAEEASDALVRSPDDVRVLVALGVAETARGRYAEAAAVLDRAVARAPRRPEGYVQRAIARVGLGTPADLAAARDDAEAAAAITPRSPVVRRLLRRLR